MKKNRVKKILAALAAMAIVISAVPTAAVLNVSAKTYKFWIDAGHGGSDPGACNGDRHEADDTLYIANRVGQILENYGIDVAYTRTDDSSVDYTARAGMARNYGADFFISIHRNSTGNASANGLETYYHLTESADSPSAQFANLVQNNLLDVTGYYNRGVANDDDGVEPRTGFAVLCGGMTSVLTELGFISNTNDNSIFDSKKDDMVVAIAKACLTMCGMTYQVKTPEQVRDEIAALPDAASIAKANAEAVRSARSDYNSLTDDNKKLVTNYDKLVLCEQALNDLLYGKASPSGSILKVNYSNTNDNCGYKYLDKLSSAIPEGAKLVYDVYLENDVSGIGGLDLSNKGESYARDDGDVVDQNGIAGHPASDISDYAYKKWYHRVVSIPGGWGGNSFTDYYTLIAFDTFTGNATAYFDNIKLVSSDGNDIEYFFKDGGTEYSFDGSEYAGYSDGVTVQTVKYDSVFKKDGFTVSVRINKDGELWTDSNKTIMLQNGSKLFSSDDTGAELSFSVAESAIYTVLDGGISTGVTVTVDNADAECDVNFLTVPEKFADKEDVSVSAKYDGSPVAAGDILLAGKKLELTASSSFKNGKTFYQWSSGETAEKITVDKLETMPAVTVSTILWGDANTSGEVDTADALVILQYTVNKINLSENTMAVCDVNGDGNVDSSDALLILQYSVKIFSEFPVVSK